MVLGLARRGWGLLNRLSHRRLVPCLATTSVAPTALVTKCTVPLATTIAMHATLPHRDFLRLFGIQIYTLHMQ